MAKLHLLGFLDKDRAGVGKIESQLIYVSDYDLHYFARVFEVTIGELVPELAPERRIDDQLAELMKRRNNRRSTNGLRKR